MTLLVEPTCAPGRRDSTCASPLPDRGEGAVLPHTEHGSLHLYSVVMIEGQPHPTPQSFS